MRRFRKAEVGGSNPLLSSYASVAQSVEPLPCKQEVVGSIPTGSSQHGRDARLPARTPGQQRADWSIAQLAELPAVTRTVVGSKPTGPVYLRGGMADTLVSETSVERRGGSSPPVGTMGL